MIVNKYNQGGGSGSGSTDLTNYWNSAITQEHIDSASSIVYSSASSYTDRAVSGLASEQYVQEALSGVDLTNYWTSAQTEEKVASAFSYTNEIEQITASAYTSLHDGLMEVSGRTSLSSGDVQTQIDASVSGKADKMNIADNSGVLRFPSWNRQGIITGKISNAYNPESYINGKKKQFVDTNGNGAVTIYAPTDAGTAGQILMASGNTPVWIDNNYVTSAQVETQIAGAVSGISSDKLNPVSSLPSNVDAGTVVALASEGSGLPSGITAENMVFHNETWNVDMNGRRYVIPDDGRFSATTGDSYVLIGYVQAVYEDSSTGAFYGMYLHGDETDPMAVVVTLSSDGNLADPDANIYVSDQMSASFDEMEFVPGYDNDEGKWTLDIYPDDQSSAHTVNFSGAVTTEGSMGVYQYDGSAWSEVGADLSGYYTSAQTESAITSKHYVTSAQVETQITDKNYVTSAQTETQILGKHYTTSSDQSVINIIRIEQSDYNTLLSQSATTSTTLYVVVPDSQ